MSESCGISELAGLDPEIQEQGRQSPLSNNGPHPSAAPASPNSMQLHSAKPSTPRTVPGYLMDAVETTSIFREFVVDVDTEIVMSGAQLIQQLSPPPKSSQMYPNSPKNSPRGESRVLIGKLSTTLWMRKLILLAFIFIGSLSLVLGLLLNIPRIRTGGMVGQFQFDDIDDAQGTMTLLSKIPSNLAELRAIRAIIIAYKHHFRLRVELAFMCLYLFMQAFMLPGSMFLNLLAGSLFSFHKAFLLVTMLATAGAGFCYLLSYTILKELVFYYFPDRCEWLRGEVHLHRRNLFNYVVFLRIQPIVPAWFVNVASPIVGVPFRHFFSATLLGFMPSTLMSVKAGRILSKINSLKELYDYQTLGIMFLAAGMALVPVCWRSSGSTPWSKRS